MKTGQLHNRFTAVCYAPPTFLYFKGAGGTDISKDSALFDISSFFYRMLYWTDYGLNTIEKASMDGELRTVLHNTNLESPYALTIDYDNQTLFWVDYSLNRLESSSVDGSERTLLTTVNIVSLPLISRSMMVSCTGLTLPMMLS